MEEKKEVTKTVREEIEISLDLQRATAQNYGVTERTVQSAMRFETKKSAMARLLQSYALHNGGEQYRITTIKEVFENPYKEVTTTIKERIENPYKGVVILK